MAEYIEREFNPCDVCSYKRCGNCILHELAMKFVGHPAADVAEVVHGRWTENHHVSYDDLREEDVHWYTYTCSECGGEVMNDYRYCPNCGARMDGDKDAH